MSSRFARLKNFAKRKTRKKKARGSKKAKPKKKKKKTKSGRINWGKAKPIKVRTIVTVSLLPWAKKVIKIEGAKKRREEITKQTGLTDDEQVKAVDKVFKKIKSQGVNTFHSAFSDTYDAWLLHELVKVPQRTGFLRDDLSRTIKASYRKIKSQGFQKLFPIRIRLGAPETQYAAVVEKYDNRVHVRHKAGSAHKGGGRGKSVSGGAFVTYKSSTGSGRTLRYNPMKGDPQAIHHWFSPITKGFHDMTAVAIPWWISHNWGGTLAEAKEIVDLFLNITYSGEAPFG